VPLPRNYILGIDIQQQDFENYGRPSYLRGEWRDHGWWYYYLYAAVIKVPLGLWTLGVLTLCLPYVTPAIPVQAGIENVRPPFQGGKDDKKMRGDSSVFRDALILLTPPLIIFCVASAKTGFSEHFRYVLPCFPFLFIWLSQAARVFIYPREKLGNFDVLIYC
jgi:hypothetical protein